MRSGWFMQRYHGDIHIFPLCDKAIHTIPMCWCRPRCERPNRGARMIYAHNAIDGREREERDAHN